MDLKIFKICFYIILVLLIVCFYTKNLNIFGNKFYKNIKTITNPNKAKRISNNHFNMEMIIVTSPHTSPQKS